MQAHQRFYLQPRRIQTWSQYWLSFLPSCVPMRTVGCRIAVTSDKKIEAFFLTLEEISLEISLDLHPKPIRKLIQLLQEIDAQRRNSFGDEKIYIWIRTYNLKTFCLYEATYSASLQYLVLSPPPSEKFSLPTFWILVDNALIEGLTDYLKYSVQDDFLENTGLPEPESVPLISSKLQEVSPVPISSKLKEDQPSLQRSENEELPKSEFR